jgi:hypothetical protein
MDGLTQILLFAGIIIGLWVWFFWLVGRRIWNLVQYLIWCNEVEGGGEQSPPPPLFVNKFQNWILPIIVFFMALGFSTYHGIMYEPAGQSMMNSNLNQQRMQEDSRREVPAVQPGKTETLAERTERMMRENREQNRDHVREFEKLKPADVYEESQNDG